MVHELKFNNKTDGHYFTDRMIAAVVNGQLRPRQHDAMEWLRLLTPGELAQLGQMLQALIESPEGDGHQDLVTLVLHLSYLETGQQSAVSLDLFADRLQNLWVMCHLQTYVIQGYVKLYGRWRITEPDDTEHYASLTEQGYRVAARPGSPPFLRNLKDQTGDANWN